MPDPSAHLGFDYLQAFGKREHLRAQVLARKLLMRFQTTTTQREILLDTEKQEPLLMKLADRDRVVGH